MRHDLRELLRRGFSAASGDAGEVATALVEGCDVGGLGASAAVAASGDGMDGFLSFEGLLTRSERIREV